MTWDGTPLASSPISRPQHGGGGRCDTDKWLAESTKRHRSDFQCLLVNVWKFEQNERIPFTLTMSANTFVSAWLPLAPLCVA